MIVCAHQPGYLPGVSVMAKVAASDAVIWLDDVRYTTPGWTNRNQLPDGTWLTVPVERESHRSTIREVTIGGDERWRGEHVRLLDHRYGDTSYFDHAILEVLDVGDAAGVGESLLGLNLTLLELICDGLASPLDYTKQSGLSPQQGTLSRRLARMVREVGGTEYLSGPTNALDRETFEAEGVGLSYFRYAGPNPSVIDPLFRLGKLPESSLSRNAGTVSAHA